MIINMTCGGGSADGLNVKIVASTTQPSNPQENTIWVNTGEPIHGWYFSATQPSSVQSGAIWIQTGSDSSVAFNAAKNDVLMVYPIACKQYITNAWVDVTAKSYINSAWVDWIIYLYSPGNTHDGTTGGWEGKAHRRQDKVDGNDVTSSAPGITLGEESMTVTLGPVPEWQNYSGSARTVKKIDLTGFEQIVFDMNINGGTVEVYVTQSEFSYSPAAAHSNVTNNMSSATLDVSALSGEYYVGINLLATSLGTQTVTVTRITVK